MISPRMNRPLRLILPLVAVLAVAVGAAACGTEKIGVPASDSTLSSDKYAATLFSQRCAGCHTLSYAGTHGSGNNPRTYEAINGPNFNVRCERPAIRVLYAIENGGFSGAYMPPNIVTGADAHAVAMFVARFAGRQAPQQPGVRTCTQQAIGTLPQPGQPLATATSSTPTTSTTSGPSTPNGPKTGAPHRHHKSKKK
jgi:mono/diheme cytochrome c family protein